jgi:hypothetical protein
MLPPSPHTIPNPSHKVTPKFHLFESGKELVYHFEKKIFTDDPILGQLAEWHR